MVCSIRKIIIIIELEKEMDCKIKNTYKVTETHELSIDWDGWNFLVIYGKHKNGWFIAIPNWNVCTEAGEPTDEYYNTTKLAQAHFHDTAPSVLAQAIKEHWENY